MIFHNDDISGGGNPDDIRICRTCDNVADWDGGRQRYCNECLNAREEYEWEMAKERRYAMKYGVADDDNQW